MIKTFANKETAALFANEKVRRLPSEIRTVARRKLAQLHQVISVEELRIPPGNRLVKLSGSSAGQWNIRINDQWLVCFVFESGHAFQSTRLTLKSRIITKETGMSIKLEDLREMDFSDVAERGRVSPLHPGEILREEFMTPLGLSASAVAIALQVPAPRINDIVRERRGISADTAVRLARFFGMRAEFWLGLQADYDRRMAEIKLAEVLARIPCYQPIAA